MALTMSPTGLPSPVDKDRADYTIFPASGRWGKSTKSAAPP